MVAFLDERHTPRVFDYVNGLTNGFETHPHARVRSDVLNHVRERLMPTGPSLPPEMIEVLENRSDEIWHAEVVGVALMLACRDLTFESDEDFLQWGYDSSRALFESPLNRMVMMVVSPTLVAMGAAKKWANFHKGSEIFASGVMQEGDVYRVEGGMRFPDGIFPKLITRRWCRSILAALSRTRAHNPSIEVTSYTPTGITFTVTWG